VLVSGFAASVLLVVASLRVGLQPFAGTATTRAVSAHEAPAAMWMPPLLLASLGLVIGLMPRPLVAALVSGAALAAHGEPTVLELALWHGVSPVLALSLATLAAGAALYRFGDPAFALLREHSAGFSALGPQAAYESALRGLKFLAASLDSLLQHGPVRRRLLVVFSALTLLLGGVLLVNGDATFAAPTSLRLHEAALLLLVALATAGTVFAPSPLAAVACLGAVGYGIALLFALFGAPDLAMTQFAIETLTVILLALVLRRATPPRVLASASGRGRDAAVAAAFGVSITVALLAVGGAANGSRLAGFFAEAAVPQAQGRNVVNVILVDFRALDTLGEIVVVTLAALGVGALGKRRASPAAAVAAAPASFSLRFAAVYLVPLLLLISVFLLLRGHNAPGGGFTGGLVAAASIALLGMAQGHAAARRVLRCRPTALIATGLAITASSGLLASASGKPFLTGRWTPLPVPIAGKLGTPLLFDIGVYLVVIGAALHLFFHFAAENDS
jgi:multicomponent Na+:H+ antiporter subunit A